VNIAKVGGNHDRGYYCEGRNGDSNLFIDFHAKKSSRRFEKTLRSILSKDASQTIFFTNLARLRQKNSLSATSNMHHIQFVWQ